MICVFKHQHLSHSRSTRRLYEVDIHLSLELEKHVLVVIAGDSYLHFAICNFTFDKLNLLSYHFEHSICYKKQTFDKVYIKFNIKLRIPRLQ